MWLWNYWNYLFCVDYRWPSSSDLSENDSLTRFQCCVQEQHVCKIHLLKSTTITGGREITQGLRKQHNLKYRQERQGPPPCQSPHDDLFQPLILSKPQILQDGDKMSARWHADLQWALRCWQSNKQGCGENRYEKNHTHTKYSYLYMKNI